MSGHRYQEVKGIRLTLPATSANLGPGFDAAALAMSLTLQLEARAAGHDSIEASGLGAEVCGALEDNLILESYRTVMTGAGKAAGALSLVVENEIPLGMGCGSSAAARLAGVALANHFGQLGMDDAAVVTEASRLEGHPDNVAACWYGGYTVSVSVETGVIAASFAVDSTWQLLLALPEAGLATEAARALLPVELSREDAIFNLQRAALLTAAFAQERLDLLRIAMEDRLHQPHRRKVCGLLEHLDKLHAAPEFAGVALSGAGPALLGILSERATLHAAEKRMHDVLGAGVMLLPVRVGGPASVEVLG